MDSFIECSCLADPSYTSTCDLCAGTGKVRVTTCWVCYDAGRVGDAVCWRCGETVSKHVEDTTHYGH